MRLFFLFFFLTVAAAIPCKWDLTISTEKAIAENCGYECENPWGKDDPYYCKKCHPCCCAPKCDFKKAKEEAMLGINWNDHYTKKPLPRTFQFQILKDSGFKYIKTFSPSGLNDILRVYGEGGVKVYVGIPNKELTKLSTSEDYARQIVREQLKPYESIVAGLIVGNEPLICIKTANWEANRECGALNSPVKLLPAMKMVRKALVAEGMPRFVSTALNGGIMEMSKNPWTPCIADYKEFLKPILHPLWDFMRETKAPFIVNLYSWFATIGNNITPKVACGVPDLTLPSDGKYSYYFNFDMQVDMNRVAMCKNNAADLDFWVGETGWPTSNHEKATLTNAYHYVNNVLRRSQGAWVADPVKDTMRFKATNEEKKYQMEHGNLFENSFGLFYESGVPKWTDQHGMLKFNITGKKTKIEVPPLPTEYSARG